MSQKCRDVKSINCNFFFAIIVYFCNTLYLTNRVVKCGENLFTIPSKDITIVTHILCCDKKYISQTIMNLIKITTFCLKSHMPLTNRRTHIFQNSQPFLLIKANKLFWIQVYEAVALWVGTKFHGLVCICVYLTTTSRPLRANSL